MLSADRDATESLRPCQQTRRLSPASWFVKFMRYHFCDINLAHLVDWMAAFLYEIVTNIEGLWIGSLGDIGRYKMAIGDDDSREKQIPIQIEC